MIGPPKREGGQVGRGMSAWTFRLGTEGIRQHYSGQVIIGRDEMVL